MSQFVEVTGDDPFYKSQTTYMYLAVGAIHRIYPIYGIKSGEGEVYARCVASAEGATLCAYHIYDTGGRRYITLPRQVEGLGLKALPKKTITGFMNALGEESPATPSGE